MVYADGNFFIKAKDDASTRKVLKDIQAIIPMGLQTSSVKKYWKEGGVYEVAFSLDMSEYVGDVNRSVCSVLESAWNLGGPWSVSSIGAPFHGNWEFEALADGASARFKIRELQWARFSLVVTP